MFSNEYEIKALIKVVNKRMRELLEKEGQQTTEESMELINLIGAAFNLKNTRWKK